MIPVSETYLAGDTVRLQCGEHCQASLAFQTLDTGILAELRGLRVPKRERRKGNGHALVKKAIDISREKGATRIWGVIEKNMASGDREKAEKCLRDFEFSVDKNGHFQRDLQGSS